MIHIITIQKLHEQEHLDNFKNVKTYKHKRFKKRVVMQIINLTKGSSPNNG